MEEYLEEINTALSMRGAGVHYESMDDVKSALDKGSERCRDRAIRYSTIGAAMTGSGVFGKLNPQILEGQAQEIPSLTADQMASLGLGGGLMVSILPVWRAYRNKQKADELENMVETLEQDDFDRSDTGFAYEVVENLGYGGSFKEYVDPRK